MSIFLLNKNIRGVVSSEETMWSVLADNLPNCSAIALANFEGNIKEYLKTHKPDILIYNSRLGQFDIKCKKIVILQDNYLAMQKLVPWTTKRWLVNLLKGDPQTQTIKHQREALANADIIVSVSRDVAHWYGIKSEFIPIGTNSELFKPIDKSDMRKKYDIPKNRFVKIYVGSTHPVKGFDLITKEIEKDKETFYVLVLKDERIPKLGYKNIKVFHRVSQQVLAELYNCADLFFGRSRVETLWLAPIEAMFCNIPIDVTSTGIFADWFPQNKNPRQEAFDKGLDRETMIEKWKMLIKDIE